MNFSSSTDFHPVSYSTCNWWYWKKESFIKSCLIYLFTVLWGDGPVWGGDTEETPDVFQTPRQACRSWNSRTFLGHRDGGHFGVWGKRSVLTFCTHTHKHTHKHRVTDAAHPQKVVEGDKTLKLTYKDKLIFVTNLHRILHLYFTRICEHKGSRWRQAEV